MPKKNERCSLQQNIETRDKNAFRYNRSCKSIREVIKRPEDKNRQLEEDRNITYKLKQLQYLNQYSCGRC